jgi:hypothetical protein
MTAAMSTLLSFNVSSPGGNDTRTDTASYPSPSTFTNTPNDPSILTDTMTWPQILAQRTPKHLLSITYNTHSLTCLCPQRRCPLDGCTPPLLRSPSKSTCSSSFTARQRGRVVWDEEGTDGWIRLRETTQATTPSREQGSRSRDGDESVSREECEN